VRITRCCNNYGPDQLPETVIPLFTNLLDERTVRSTVTTSHWTKIAAELGYAPQVPFETRLTETLHWYAANRDWWQPLKAAPVIRDSSVTGCPLLSW
jgi:dTDP-D-glucose 4,6-dehydratase